MSNSNIYLISNAFFIENISCFIPLFDLPRATIVYILHSSTVIMICTVCATTIRVYTWVAFIYAPVHPRYSHSLTRLHHTHTVAIRIVTDIAGAVCALVSFSGAQRVCVLNPLNSIYSILVHVCYSSSLMRHTRNLIHKKVFLFFCTPYIKERNINFFTLTI